MDGTGNLWQVGELCALFARLSFKKPLRFLAALAVSGAQGSLLSGIWCRYWYPFVDWFTRPRAPPVAVPADAARTATRPMLRLLAKVALDQVPFLALATLGAAAAISSAIGEVEELRRDLRCCHCLGMCSVGVLILLHNFFSKRSMCMCSRDLYCRAQVTLTRSPCRVTVHIACVPRLHCLTAASVLFTHAVVVVANNYDSAVVLILTCIFDAAL